MPNGIFEGGMLPPVVVKGTRVLGGDDPFDPYGFNFNNLSRFDDVLDQYDSGVGGGGGGGNLTEPPVDNSKQEYDPTSLFETKHKEYVKDELYKINQERIKKGQNPISNSDYGAIADALKTLEAKIPEWDVEIAEQKAALTPRSGASGGNSGIPLIIPIPGIDPVTGLAITAAGLIFSGGNVAKLDPANPIQSVVNAGKGTVNTIGNAVDVIQGDQDIRDIWGTGTTSGAGSGGAGSGAGAGTGNTAGTGSIVGGQNQVIGLDPAGMGVIGVLGTGSSSGASQTPGGGSNVNVTPGALGGATAGQTQTSTIASSAQIAQARANINAANQAASAVLAANTSNVNTGSDVSTGTNTNTNTNQTTNTGTATSVASTDWSRVNAAQAAAAQDKINRDAAAIASVSTGPTNTSCPAGQERKNGACVPITIGPSTNTPSGSTSVSTTPIVTTPTFTFTNSANTGLAQRDYGKEFGITSNTLTGQAGDDLAKYYQKLQQQFTPSSLTTLGREAEAQLAADMARYNEAQRGNLSAEDVRTAQQGAREAYAARGQVMGRGAIGAEILNRDALQRQREAEARASVQQSMGNLANAANLQTGNIFSPFASLISQTYSPTNQYAREVYDYNVNAYNAYQAAEKNLAAYKEAAAKGQEAQFINSFVGFLANNGVQTTTSAVTSIINGLLGGGAKKPAGT